MEAATWVIAIAGVVNVFVLGAYAWYTRGILDATRQSTLRTEELARQAGDGLRLQILATFLEETRQKLALTGADPALIQLHRSRMAEVRNLLHASFPEQWAEIQRDVDNVIEWMFHQDESYEETL